MRLEPEAPFTAALLAPLAVMPGRQRQGIGGQLIEAGMRELVARGVALVFVLGYPDYYTRHGFSPAGRQGFEAPYPLTASQADAWMVRELLPGTLGAHRGSLTKPVPQFLTVHQSLEPGGNTGPIGLDQAGTA